MSTLKPLKLYGGIFPANPLKVALVLEELGLPYETEDVPMAERKKPPFTNINPNGRTPALYDPNTDLNIWESGAIVSYLVDKYDKDHKISFPHDTNEYYKKVPSAIDRYYNEINRVVGVLEKWLAGSEDGGDGKGPRNYIMGDKCTYTDLVLFPWQIFLPRIVWKGKLNPETEFPNVMAWVKRIGARPSLERILTEVNAIAEPFLKAAEEKMAKAAEEEKQ
ncbi:glutathione transferase [Trichophyton violaceum]|uniref:Glutathione transferase n=1 Tax=Trichophyton violaceum TaxID=34388 RepID=A0A178FJY0_TRIVO|nr:glutathione transferase [Trichophyton violaceum]